MTFNNIRAEENIYCSVACADGYFYDLMVGFWDE